MKRKAILILLTVLMLMVGAAYAQENNGMPNAMFGQGFSMPQMPQMPSFGNAGGQAEVTLCINADGEVRVKPDLVNLSIGVAIEKPVVSEAQTEASAIISATIDALRSAGVAEEDISTGNFSVSPTYDYSQDNARLTGYRVLHEINVVCRKTEDAGKLIDLAIGCGCNNGFSIEFASSQRNEAYDAALKAAILRAHEKARTACEASGCEVTGIKSITENASGGRDYAPVMYRAKEGASAEGSMPIMNGELTVHASVEIVYLLKTN